MNYYKCKWLSATIEDPFNMIFEVNDDFFEIRKIEVFKNGKYGYAYNNIEVNGTGLGIIPMPSIQEINSNPEFEMEEIKKEDFEFLWNLMVEPSYSSD